MMDRLDAAVVPRLAEPYARGWIEDWSTCDWYCVKVLGRLIERHPHAAPAIAAWRDAESLWQRRWASVAFVYLVPKGLHHELVLGEMRKSDPVAVDAFLAEHRDPMSSEARRRAAG